MSAAKTSTTSMLLTGLMDPENSEVWQEFDARYRPMILAYAMRLGLASEDAADVAQDVLLRFVQEYRAGRYDRARGRLGAWIVGIVRYRVADHKRSSAARRVSRGESAIVELMSEDDMQSLWEIERKKGILRQAVDELRASSKMNEKTIRAFELFAIHQRPASSVAAELDLTAQDVYMAKNRVAARLREILERLENLFDD
ncbi:MAG TPA: sigma-70 family RNA polymerase sigma factor [Phycisphaerae bacterium]|nr:sigma-70 family RNA polymerase sigma factor [Phycisphaerae bacterium]